MAAVTSARIRITIETFVIGDSEGDNRPRWTPVKEKVINLPNGTSAGQIDAAYIEDTSAAGSAATFDLRGSLTNEVRTAGTQAFTDVVAFWIDNTATATGKTLEVGAGSNPWITWVKATGDAVKVPAGGFLFWYAGDVDDIQTTATTGDVLTIDPGANTIGFQVGVLGRSA